MGLREETLEWGFNKYLRPFKALIKGIPWRLPQCQGWEQPDWMRSWKTEGWPLSCIDTMAVWPLGPELPWLGFWRTGLHCVSWLSLCHYIESSKTFLFPVCKQAAPCSSQSPSHLSAPLSQPASHRSFIFLVIQYLQERMGLFTSPQFYWHMSVYNWHGLKRTIHLLAISPDLKPEKMTWSCSRRNWGRILWKLWGRRTKQEAWGWGNGSECIVFKGSGDGGGLPSFSHLWRWLERKEKVPSDITQVSGLL